MGGRDRGVVTAEFIVVLPMLLFLFFLMVDFGWLLKNWLVVTNAARESTRCAIASSCFYDGGPVDPEDLALARMHNSGVSDQTNIVGEPDVETFYIDHDGNGLDHGDSFVVCIEAQNEYITPALILLSFVSGAGSGGGLPNPMPLRAREEMLIEFVDPDGVLQDVDPGDGPCDFDT